MCRRCCCPMSLCTGAHHGNAQCTLVRCCTPLQGVHSQQRRQCRAGHLLPPPGEGHRLQNQSQRWVDQRPGSENCQVLQGGVTCAWSCGIVQQCLASRAGLLRGRVIQGGRLSRVQGTGVNGGLGWPSGGGALHSAHSSASCCQPSALFFPDGNLDPRQPRTTGSRSPAARFSCC